MSARSIYKGPAVTVTFQDHGQDFLKWDIENGKVVSCRPFQARVWCGLEIHCKPSPGEKLRIKNHEGKLTWIKYPLTKVKPLAPVRTDKVSKAVLNSTVVTRGAKALLADYRKREAA